MSQALKDCSWKAQVRLHGRMKRLLALGKRPNKAIVAVARELAALKAYLNGHAIRLGSRRLCERATRIWIESRRAWSPLQKSLLEGYFFALEQSHQQRERYLRIICQEVSREPLMLRLMKLLGIGKIDAFGLLAVIGDARRFCSPQKLVAYLGLNPGQRESGNGKRICIGIGRRGRGDMRHLLIQGAQAILRTGNASALGQWGWKLFARKGSRNVAVAAVARKLVVQVWHLLHGNAPMALEKDRSFTIKLRKLAIHIGKELRIELGLGLSLEHCIQTLRRRVRECGPPAPEAIQPA